MGCNKYSKEGVTPEFTCHWAQRKDEQTINGMVPTFAFLCAAKPPPISPDQLPGMPGSMDVDREWRYGMFIICVYESCIYTRIAAFALEAVQADRRPCICAAGLKSPGGPHTIFSLKLTL